MLHLLSADIKIKICYVLSPGKMLCSRQEGPGSLASMVCPGEIQCGVNGKVLGYTIPGCHHMLRGLSTDLHYLPTTDISMSVAAGFFHRSHSTGQGTGHHAIDK